MANSKKINEITQVQSLANSDLLIADTNNGTRAIKYKDLAPMEQNPHLYRNGAYLPSVNLGTSYTAELKEDIQSGRFQKAVVGGYLTINGHIYDFAHPDYWLNTGDTACNTHHMVVVPRTNLVNEQMHKTSSGQYEAGAANTTEGAYIESDMRKDPNGGIAKIRAIIQQDFGAANILSHKELLANATTDGKSSAWSWYESDIELMNEVMVYGCNVWSSSPAYDTGIDKTQLELFAKRPDLITNRAGWWLRSVASGAAFALVGDGGDAGSSGASGSGGVRPAFAIC